jgi:hypothetical protein
LIVERRTKEGKGVKCGEKAEGDKKGITVSDSHALCALGTLVCQAVPEKHEKHAHGAYAEEQDHVYEVSERGV